jgi:hypothetical protein
LSDKQCPICYDELISKLVSPCMECGANDAGIANHRHTSYHEYELYFGFRLILCDFCYVDFGSYDPTHFGFPRDKKIGLQDFSFIKDVTCKDLFLDKCCPSCEQRLVYLKFIQHCREKNKS